MEDTERTSKTWEKVVLVTGGYGFIGSHIVRYLVNNRPNWLIINMDCLTYAGNLENLNDINITNDNYVWYLGDIREESEVEWVFADYGVTDVIHLAAESHVDNSITGPRPFIETNVMGTFNLLETARKVWGNEEGHRFYYFSTDEVFGFLGESEEAFTEETKLDPTSPYSASKACGDLIVKAYWKTFKLPIIISHMCNAIGPNQFPEKLVPATIQRVLNNEPIIVYDKGEQVREWIYTEDVVNAAMCVFEKGIPGEAYNIGSGYEVRNIDIVKSIINWVCFKTTDNQEDFKKKIDSVLNNIKYVENARPGHDFRYAINHSKITNELGWEPKVEFGLIIPNTVDWYLNNQEWVENLKNRTNK